MRWTVPLTALVLLSACSSGPTSSAPLQRPSGVVTSAPSASEPADPSPGAALATLIVRQRYRGPGYYIEGSIGFVEVAASPLTRTPRVERQIPSGGRVRFSLRPGTYVLTSWQRPCDGACDDGFDPPVDGCEASFTVGRTETLTAVVTVSPSGFRPVSTKPNCEIVFS